MDKQIEVMRNFRIGGHEKMPRQEERLVAQILKFKGGL